MNEITIDKDISDGVNTLAHDLKGNNVQVAARLLLPSSLCCLFAFLFFFLNGVRG